MKFVRHRRGLSNVVTAAIMLTSVAIMGSAMVSWSHGNLSAFQNSLANTTSTVTNKINENLVIEHVQFCQSSCPKGALPAQKGMNITITNTGSEGITVSAIQINGSLWAGTASTLPFKLTPHQSYTYGHNSLIWQSKDVQKFTVTTSRGTIVTTLAVAP